MKQYSAACDENRQPILQVLKTELHSCRSLLEIGSGTGQHAVYFGRDLPQLQWQPSDLECHHASISAWLTEARLANVLQPITLDVARDDWPEKQFDAVFSANTCHIMAWQEVECMFRGIGQVLAPGGMLCLYGPFNYQRQYTSESNRRFDQWLRERDPSSGVRDFEDLDALAMENGLSLHADYIMPVNNHLLWWQNTGT